jgi:Flp pilus assembly secretin CpaC
MENSSRKTSRSQKVIGAVAVVVMLSICSVEDCRAQKSAAAEADNIISNLSRIELTAEPNIPIPEVYRQPPIIREHMVGGEPEFRLTYFCKHHTSEELKQIIHEQFSYRIFNKPGKPPQIATNYIVSSNPATNQLIVRCPTKYDAEAVLQTLKDIDIAPIQVNIHCIISEVYADRTVDRQTSIMVTNLFGEHVWAGPSGQPYGTAVMDLIQEAALLPAFPGAQMRELGRAKMGLQIGYVDDKFLSLLDILESQGYLKIVMNPILEVVNAKMAKVSLIQEVPLQQTYLKSPRNDWYETKIDYQPVEDSLQITPHVFADDYIGLETKILLGSKLTPEGVKQLPIITKKEIDNKENRIRRGESLMIGGIRKSERRDVVRGVPFLKDIPLLGMFFSGRDFEERVVETMFILTPTISTGGVPRTEMIEDLKEKHEPVDPGALEKTITDPLGFKAREREQQRKTDEAEQARLTAEKERAEARNALREANLKVKNAEAEAEKARAELDQVKAEAEKTVADAEKAKAEAQAMIKAAERAKAEAAQKSNAEEGKAKAQEPTKEAAKGTG